MQLHSWEALLPRRPSAVADVIDAPCAPQDEKYREEVQASMLKRQKAVTKRRESRTPPEGDPFAMIDYLLDTPAEDLEFEIARCRPLLNDVFFQTLDREIGNCKATNKPNRQLQASSVSSLAYAAGQSWRPWLAWNAHAGGQSWRP